MQNEESILTGGRGRHHDLHNSRDGSDGGGILEVSTWKIHGTLLSSEKCKDYCLTPGDKTDIENDVTQYVRWTPNVP